MSKESRVQRTNPTDSHPPHPPLHPLLTLNLHILNKPKARMPQPIYHTSKHLSFVSLKDSRLLPESLQSAAP